MKPATPPLQPPQEALDRVGTGRFQWLMLAICGLGNAADAARPYPRRRLAILSRMPDAANPKIPPVRRSSWRSPSSSRPWASTARAPSASPSRRWRS